MAVSQRRRRKSQSRCHRHQRIGQGAGLMTRFHERAGAKLHIQHQRRKSFGQFLAENARRDQRDRSDRARHVAQRVELAVGGHQIGGGRGNGATGLRDDAGEFLAGEIRADTGNGFKLVERAAGGAQSAARDHRHLKSAASQQRRHDERRLVANAAGGVLVHSRADIFAFEDVAGLEHGLRRAQRSRRASFHACRRPWPRPTSDSPARRPTHSRE